VRETAATIDASFPWIRATRGLMSEAELQGLARELSPATRDLARLTDQAIELLPQTNLVSMCARDVLLPTGDVVIRDEFETGRENYKDFFYAMVGLAGEGQNFDANGTYVRFQTGGGAQPISIGTGNGGTPPQFGGLPTPPLGNRPRYPGKVPPYEPDEPCHRQKLADVNGPAAAKSLPTGSPGATAQVKSMRDKLRKEADLNAVRTKLDPFGTAKKRGVQEKAK
jgi:hypothetical protein